MKAKLPMMTPGHDQETKSCLMYLRSSNKVIVALIYATLLVDTMLLTAIVPILPEYLLTIHRSSENKKPSLFNNTAIAKSEHASSTAAAVATFTESKPTLSKNMMTPSKCKTNNETQYLSQESFKIGLLFSSKPLLQVISNLAIGPLTDRIGFDIPLLAGYIIMFVSSITFSFGTNYYILLLARAVQGIGSACAATAGMGLVVSAYSNNDDRAKAMGITLGGLAVGSLVGPVYGSVVYQLAGKEAVFLTLAGFSISLAGFQLFVRKLQLHGNGDIPCKGTPLTTLFCDPFIMIVATSITLGSLCIGVADACVPTWMIKTLCSPKWQLGVVYVLATLLYLITTHTVSVLFHRIPQYIVSFLGMIVMAVSCLVIPYMSSFIQLFIAFGFLGMGIGMVDASMFPAMGQLVDSRHTPVYGSVYAIADVGMCFGFIIAPAASGGLVEKIGFKWVMIIAAIICFVFSPWIFLLKKPLAKSEEEISILSQVQYEHTDVPNEDSSIGLIGSD